MRNWKLRNTSGLNGGFMKRVGIICVAGFFLILMSTDAFGQTLLDSFSDGDFTANPVWGGDTGSWTIVANSSAAAGATGSNTLRLNFTTAAAGSQYLSTQVATWGAEQEWGFWVGRRATGFTAGNQMMIWLYANEADLESATVDGYRLLIGDDVGNDEIFLQSVTNGVGTTILTSSGAITNGLTDIGFLVRVTRDGNGLFTLYTSTLPTANGTGAIATDIPNATNANVLQGSVTNTAFIPASNGYLGVVAVHTSGATARDTVEFDQIYFTITTPTAVKMSEFTAKSSGNGVMLEWKTGFEVNNLGFKVYRERKGKRVQINRSIIAGSALMAVQGTAMTAGNSYSWVDPAGTSDSIYYLEDIDIDGTRTMHGPVVPAAGASSIKSARTILLDDLNASARENKIAEHSQRGWAFSAGSQSSAKPHSEADTSESVNTTAASDSRSQFSASATSSSQSPDKQKALAAMPGLKLSVREDGWYRATQAALVAAGLNANADMRYLQLYADGIEVPVVINSSKPTGPLKAGDSIEFYGIALDTPSADRREYWLVSGTTLGKRIKAQALKNVSSSGALPSFDYTVERKERLLYFSGLLNGDTENFFGQVINSTPSAQTLSVQHLNPAAVSRLEVALQGVTLQDHVVRVLVNGTEVGVLNFTGQQNKVAQLTILAGVLREGDNTVTLERTNGDMDISLVDYLRLSYAHTYQADNDYLQFTVSGRAQVRGFSVASVVLLDITDPNAVSLYNPKTEKAADGYRFTLQTSESRTFLALTDQKIGQLAALTRNQPSNWNANVQGADFIIITHRNFRNSVEPLAQLRRNEGMSVAVVDTEDVYDEFSYGAHDSRAIRDFLEWTQTHWLRVPRFVLLVGDGSFDPRNYLGNNGETDLVPAHLVDTALLETVSDDWLVDFDNDGVGEMALGRLPVRTAVEADTMISKIVNYSPANTTQTALMVADRMDAKTNFNFEAASDELGSLLPATIGVQKIYRSDNAPSVVHDQIVNGINQGPLLVNFMGHGSVEVWTGEPILSTSDAALFNNGSRLPVFLMMTCLNGYYQNPARESLAESLIRSDAGGAVAVWASSGMTEPAPQFDMSTVLYPQVFGSQSLTLGEAIRKAKLGNADIDVRRTWILFGDPTMRVR
jgi:peptidase C25-like protein